MVTGARASHVQQRLQRQAPTRPPLEFGKDDNRALKTLKGMHRAPLHLLGPCGHGDRELDLTRKGLRPDPAPCFGKGG
jgi:hypothetical protein